MDELNTVPKVSVPKRPPKSRPEHVLTIESLSHEGRGIAHVNGKVVFVEGALAGEQVRVQIQSQQKRFAQARVLEVLQSSAERVEPPCTHAGICGGCSLQHWSTDAQIAFKQRVLAEQFQHFGQIQPQRWLAPLRSSTTGYRRKARLGVRWVHKKNSLLIGFREKNSNFLTQTSCCSVLDNRIGMAIEDLSLFLATLSCAQHIAQIEVAAGDNAVVLIFRHLVDLPDTDRTALLQFCCERGWQAWGQRSGLESQHPLDPDSIDTTELYYGIDTNNLRFYFHPSDFTQVHAGINALMLDLAIDLLDIAPNHKVLDLFCGLGNFSVPIALKAAQVIGVEGSVAMTQRAEFNARYNGLVNTQFYAADLSIDFMGQPWAQQRYDRILLDPPRSGAEAVVRSIHQLAASKLVYVSCNPATLARDAGMLKEQGYQLSAAGVMDMFPHTSHVESIALFEHQKMMEKQYG